MSDLRSECGLWKLQWYTILIDTDIVSTRLIGLWILKDRPRPLSDSHVKDRTVHDCFHIVHILVSGVGGQYAQFPDSPYIVLLLLTYCPHTAHKKTTTLSPFPKIVQKMFNDQNWVLHCPNKLGDWSAIYHFHPWSSFLLWRHAINLQALMLQLKYQMIIHPLDVIRYSTVLLSQRCLK